MSKIKLIQGTIGTKDGQNATITIRFMKKIETNNAVERFHTISAAAAPAVFENDNISSTKVRKQLEVELLRFGNSIYTDMNSVEIKYYTDKNVEASLKGKYVRSARPARRLLNIVVHILPIQHRTRYSEELNGELWELAEAKKSRWRQLVYVMRQFVRIWELHIELRKPVRRKAGT